MAPTCVLLRHCRHAGQARHAARMYEAQQKCLGLVVGVVRNQQVAAPQLGTGAQQEGVSCLARRRHYVPWPGRRRGPVHGQHMRVQAEGCCLQAGRDGE